MTKTPERKTPIIIAERYLARRNLGALAVEPYRPEDHFRYGRDDAWPRGYRTLGGLVERNPDHMAVRTKLVDANWLDETVDRLREFVARCASGEVRSTQTQAAFRDLLAQLDED